MRHVEEDGRSSDDGEDVGGMRKVETATSRSEMQRRSGREARSERRKREREIKRAERDLIEINCE